LTNFTESYKTQKIYDKPEIIDF